MRENSVAMFLAMQCLWACGPLDTAFSSKKSDLPSEESSNAESEENEDITPEELNQLPPLNTNEMKITFQVPEIAQVITVNVDIEGVDTFETWNLFYASEINQAAGTAIAWDIPVSQTSVPWDTKGLEPDTYFLYATINFKGTEITKVWFDTKPLLAGGDLFRNNQFVDIVFPAGNLLIEDGDVFAPGEVVNIEFNSQTPEEKPLTFQIEYTSDNGETWSEIVSDLPIDTTSYAWNIPATAPRTARYKIRVNADDGTQILTSEMKDPFGVSSTQISYTNDLVGFMVGDGTDGKCAPCHIVNGNNYGQFRADSFDNNNRDVRRKADQFVDRTRPGLDNPMPPANSVNGELTIEEQDLILLWRWMGRREN